MPFQGKEKKRQKILLIVLGVMVIIAVFAFYNSQKKSVEETYQAKETTPPFGMSVEEKKLKEIKLDLGILDSELFQALKSHGVLPVVPGETGRSNPFQPSF